MKARHAILGGWALALAVVSLAGMGFTPTQGIGLPNDEDASGSSALEEMVQAQADTKRVGASLSTIVHDTDRTLFVIAPERAPLSGEARALDRFLHQGGTAVLFVASDTWNPVLSTYGVTLHGSLLLDSQDDETPFSFPVKLPDRLGGGQLVLVNATAISNPGPGVETTTPDRDLVLDLDGDHRISVPPDTAGRFATVADVPVGEGTLVVIASGDAALNENIDRHLDGVDRLVAERASQGTAFFDASMHPMGITDALREPARILGSLFHASILSAGMGIGLVAAAVYASPRIQAKAGEGNSLDERSPETEEWLQRGDP